MQFVGSLGVLVKLFVFQCGVFEGLLIIRFQLSKGFFLFLVFRVWLQVLFLKWSVIFCCFGWKWRGVQFVLRLGGVLWAKARRVEEGVVWIEFWIVRGVGFVCAGGLGLRIYRVCVFEIFQDVLFFLFLYFNDIIFERVLCFNCEILSSLMVRNEFLGFLVLIIFCTRFVFESEVFVRDFLIRL